MYIGKDLNAKVPAPATVAALIALAVAN